jgi:hypothetical protein
VGGSFLIIFIQFIILAAFFLGFPLQAYANICIATPISTLIDLEFFTSLLLVILFVLHLRTKTVKYLPPIGILLSVIWFYQASDYHINPDEHCLAFGHAILTMVGILPVMYFTHETIIQYMSSRSFNKKTMTFRFSIPAVGIILAILCFFYSFDLIEGSMCVVTPPPVKPGLHAVVFRDVSGGCGAWPVYPAVGSIVFGWALGFIIKFIIISLVTRPL